MLAFPPQPPGFYLWQNGQSHCFSTSTVPYGTGEEDDWKHSSCCSLLESALSHCTITEHHYHHLACMMTDTFHKWLINVYHFYFSLPLILLGPISHASTSQASWKAAFKVSSSRLSVIHIRDNYILGSSLKSVSTGALFQMRNVSLGCLAPEANLNVEHMEVQDNNYSPLHLLSHGDRLALLPCCAGRFLDVSLGLLSLLK